MTADAGRSEGQRGFTIIELMVSTLVFSVIMVVITSGVLSFTRQYYRGMIESRTQSVSRQIMDDIVRTIQFNPGEVYPIGTPTTSGYCIGNGTKYSFARNKQVIDGGGSPAANQEDHGLVRETVTSCGTSTAPANVATLPGVLPAGQREILGERMRLSNLSIVPASVPGAYTVTVRVVYGDDDLLCSPSIAPANAGGCDYLGNVPPPNPMIAYSNLKCKLTDGNQFCAVAELKTTVSKRVE